MNALRRLWSVGETGHEEQGRGHDIAEKEHRWHFAAEASYSELIQRCLKILKSWRFNSRERHEHFDHRNRLRAQEGSGSFPAIPVAGHCTYSHLRLLGLVPPARGVCQNDAMQLAQADASRCVGLIDIDSREEHQGTTRTGKHKPLKRISRSHRTWRTF